MIEIQLRSRWLVTRKDFICIFLRFVTRSVADFFPSRQMKQTALFRRNEFYVNGL